MLFSHPEVADFLSSSFECAWESVRPVPRLSIDFGDGRRLERTLRGNIATYVCTSAGETLDLIPGVVTAETYVARLRESLGMFARVRHMTSAPGAPATVAVRAAVAEWQSLRTRSEVLGALRASDDPSADAGAFRAFSKARVERPLESALIPPLPDHGLALDTEDAWRRGFREARALLARSGMQPPASLTEQVYRELLHVDLADPYLGLAPDVLGGEVGRH